jgi:hypothetical protein
LRGTQEGYKPPLDGSSDSSGTAPVSQREKVLVDPKPLAVPSQPVPSADRPETRETVTQKLEPRILTNFLPAKCDRLYKELKVGNFRDKRVIQRRAQEFLKAIERMSKPERLIFLSAIYYGCPTELPANIHVSVDFLKRCTGFPAANIKRLLTGMGSLGITCHVLDSSHHDSVTEGEMVYLEWDILSLADYGGEAIDVCFEIVHIVMKHCGETHGMDALLRGDFSQLSSATSTEQKH